MPDSHAIVLIQQAKQLLPKGAVSASPLWDGLLLVFPCMEPERKEGQQAVRLKGSEQSQETEKERSGRNKKNEGFCRLNVM